MSDEENNEELEGRDAHIQIKKVHDSTFYRVEIKFLDHITMAWRWDDAQEEGRSDMCALLRDTVKLCKDAFVEIDVANAHDTLDAEILLFFGPDDEVDEEVETDE